MPCPAVLIFIPSPRSIAPETKARPARRPRAAFRRPITNRKINREYKKNENLEDAMTEPLIPDPLKVGRKVLAAGHRTTLQTGIYMGAALIVVMIVALFIANRVPGTERYALERNATFCALFFVCMLIPIARYFNRPIPMFTS